VIFHDSTLQAMLDARPQNLQQLAEVHGVGDSKLERYGDAFLQCLATL
jgi:ATP-dependent DNA helicase RecQ